MERVPAEPVYILSTLAVSFTLLCRPDPSSCDIDRFPPEDTAVRAGGQPIFPLPKKIVKPTAIELFERHNLMVDAKLLAIL